MATPAPETDESPAVPGAHAARTCGSSRKAAPVASASAAVKIDAFLRGRGRRDGAEELPDGSWLCCGVFLDAKRKRCGTCQKWKGGSRSTRQRIIFSKLQGSGGAVPAAEIPATQDLGRATEDVTTPGDEGMAPSLLTAQTDAADGTCDNDGVACLAATFDARIEPAQKLEQTIAERGGEGGGGGDSKDRADRPRASRGEEARVHAAATAVAPSVQKQRKRVQPVDRPASPRREAGVPAATPEEKRRLKRVRNRAACRARWAALSKEEKEACYAKRRARYAARREGAKEAKRARDAREEKRKAKRACSRPERQRAAAEGSGASGGDGERARGARRAVRATCAEEGREGDVATTAADRKIRITPLVAGTLAPTATATIGRGRKRRRVGGAPRVCNPQRPPPPRHHVHPTTANHDMDDMEPKIPTKGTLEGVQKRLRKLEKTIADQALMPSHLHCPRFGNGPPSPSRHPVVLRRLCDDHGVLASGATELMREALRKRDRVGHPLRDHELALFHALAPDENTTERAVQTMRPKGTEKASQAQPKTANKAAQTIRPCGRPKKPSAPADRHGTPLWEGRWTWDEMYFRLSLHKADRGHCHVAPDKEDDHSLGRWVAEQRRHFCSSGRNRFQGFESERVRALVALGFDFGILHEKWEESYAELVRFRRANPDSWPVGDAPKSLGKWVRVQRQAHTCLEGAKATWKQCLERGEAVPDDALRVFMRMSQRRVDKLNEIGFLWKVHESTTWEDSFNQLKAYRSEFGNCVVPQHYEQNPHLGEWVTRMRYQYGLRQKGRRNQLTEERVQKLNEVEFQWTCKGAGAQRKTGGPSPAVESENASMSDGD